MLSYIVGIPLILFLILYFYSFGSVLTKNSDSFTKNIVIGYIIYSFLLAIFIIPIQLLKMKWQYSLISFCIIIIGTISFTAFRLYKHKLNLFYGSFKIWIKSHYFLFVITIVLMLIYLLQYDLIWINNHLDDGYYLVKASTLPYVQNPYAMNYSTGIDWFSTTFDSYALSTIETESSIWIYLFHMDPVIYCRFFLNAFNYFLAACTVTWFSNEIIQYFDIKIKRDHIQYISTILLLFSFEYTIMQRTGLMIVQDAWQFSSAMWYGSSITRVMGAMWIISSFINKTEITFKEVLFAIVVSISLISKSAVALPVIILFGFSYLITFGFFTDSKIWKGISLSLIVISLLSGFILPNVESRNTVIINNILSNKYSLILWFFIIIFIVGLYQFKNITTKKISVILTLSLLLMIIPELNDFFENVSLYDFVAARALTTWVYTFIIYGGVIFFCLIQKYLIKYFKIIFTSLLVLFSAFSVLTTCFVYGNPLRTYYHIAQNYHLMPENTVLLSKKLNEFSKDTKLNVMAPEWVIDTGNRHALAVMLRTYAPNIKSISAIRRYGGTSEGDFKDFKNEDIDVYNTFCENPDYNNFVSLCEVLNKYPINCLVFNTDNFDSYYQQINFEYVDQVGPYYIYIKKTE